jgi:hypothetical protein
MTVRQVFYRATVQGLVQKEETGYDKVKNNLTLLRRFALLLDCRQYAMATQAANLQQRRRRAAGNR